jgi:hypothetical protein
MAEEGLGGRTKKTRALRDDAMMEASLAAACRCCRSAQRLSLRTRIHTRTLQIGPWTLEPSFTDGKLRFPSQSLEHRSPRTFADTASLRNTDGTLDPLASGELVIGVGKGTKELQRYENAAVNVMLDSGREACIRSLRPLFTHTLVLFAHDKQKQHCIYLSSAKRYTTRGEIGFETTTLDRMSNDAGSNEFASLCMLFVKDRKERPCDIFWTF